MTNVPDQADTQDNGFGLLDMLVVLIEGWRPLVLVPICAAVLAYGAVMLAPIKSVYQASATVAMNPTTAALVLTPRALAEITSEAGEGLPSSAIEVTSIDTGVFVVSVMLSKQQAATDALGTILSAVTGPQFRDEGRRLVEREIDARNRRIENLHVTIDSLKTALAEIASEPSADTDDRMLEVANSIDALSETALREESALIADQQELILWQTPQLVRGLELVQHRALPSLRVIVTFAVLVSGLAVVLVLFLRDFLRRACADPRNLSKIARIRNALHLRPR